MSEHPETPEFEDGDVLQLAVLPLRNTVLFPQVVVPLAVGRAKSVKLIEEPLGFSSLRVDSARGEITDYTQSVLLRRRLRHETQ